jgi:lipopolysaccharide export system permease protein
MKSPALDIKEGVFYNGIPGYSLKVNKKLDDIRLNEIIIYNHSEGQGNLNVTMADSGRMEPFLNDNYMKMTLYQGQNYREARASRGISENPVEFSRTEFTENIIIFDLDAFQLSRTPEDQWSTNRSIKNIAEIKLGLDSIQTLINDQLYQNYQSTESTYPFFTRKRKLIPIQAILERRAKDDTLRQIRAKQDKVYNDSMGDSNLDNTVMMDTNSSTSLILSDSITTSNQKTLAELINQDTSFRKKKVNRISSQIQGGETKSDTISLSTDLPEKETQSTKLITSIDTTGTKKQLVFRSESLTEREKFVIDSVVQANRLMTNAVTLALNNARNLKNNFNVKMAQVDNFDREYRRYEIAWFQKYSQAFACFVMFMIGAPLGAIIKKGGLGMPVILSITFFILFYMLTITGEKWAKEGLINAFIGTWFSNLCLIPFGIFFLRQAKKDARLFEPDFYLELYKILQNRWKVIYAKRS